MAKQAAEGTHMDIARPDQTRKRRIKRIILGAVVVLVIGGVTLGLSRLKPAAPTADGSTVYAGTVTRGNMMIEVHGLGTLVPEDIHWIPAQSNAKVEKILLRSGAKVTPTSVIMELSDPQLESDAAAAEFTYKEAQADYDNLKATVNSQLAVLQTEQAGYEGSYNIDKMQYEVYKQEVDLGVGTKLNMDTAKMKSDQDAIQLKYEKDKVAVYADSAKAQLASQAEKVDASKSLYELKKAQTDALHVKAGINGVVECVCSVVGTDIAEGQQVTLGTNLARVADPSKLKATIQVPETQAKDVQLLQKASVDTRNGIVKGHVTREDAAAINGTVAVDITFDEKLPEGARADQSVDGTVEIQNMTNVLFVAVPVHGEPNSNITLFKVLNQGEDGERVQVRLGKGSVNYIEILGGLKEGDEVVLSDMSIYDGVDRIQFSPRVQVR
jgi:HlyD family secretion protein